MTSVLQTTSSQSPSPSPFAEHPSSGIVSVGSHGQERASSRDGRQCNEGGSSRSSADNRRGGRESQTGVRRKPQQRQRKKAQDPSPRLSTNGKGPSNASSGDAPGGCCSEAAATVPSFPRALPPPDVSGKDALPDAKSQNHQDPEKNKRRRRRRGGGGAKKGYRGVTEGKSEVVERTNVKSVATGNGTAGAKKGDDNPKRRNKKPGSKKKKNRFPWRAHVPPGAVDPISLDPIISLGYPPFALSPEEPYDVLPVWPPPNPPPPPLSDHGDSKRTADDDKKVNDLGDDRKPKGSDIPPSREGEGGKRNETPPRHFHLYDGRVLAYYLVSQLQFIDPLNRRDLTRDELVNLDRYLARHSIGNARVVEAYDNLGVTKSTAGVAGQTAQGRAEILQMEAASILSSLYETSEYTQRRGGRGTRGRGGGGRSWVAARSRAQRTSTTSERELGGTDGENDDNAARAEFRNEFKREFMAQLDRESQQQQQQRPQQQHRQQPTNFLYESNGVIAQNEGMVLIDDDENPGLRGGQENNRPEVGHTEVLGTISGGLWSASHILGRHSNSTSQLFPSLEDVSRGSANAASPSISPPAPASASGSSGGTSRSLQRIAGIVKKTSPTEAARQRRATEEARRRAALSQLAFVVPGERTVGPVGDVSGLSTVSKLAREELPSEAQIERNRVVADALGVVPSTVRSSAGQSVGGWARPTTVVPRLDEFGNELNRTEYPPALLVSARVNCDFVFKMEKRWKTFLMDDTSSSLSLRPMKRELRAMVHEYSNFWKLQTESFDAEPRRYVHCTKLLDTCAPRPLLSDAAKSYHGSALAPTQKNTSPYQPLPSRGAEGLTFGKPSTGEAVGTPNENAAILPGPVPLSSVPQGAIFGLDEVYQPAIQPVSQLSTSACSMRPKLNLAPRTLPREEKLPAPLLDAAGRYEKKLEEEKARRMLSKARIEERKMEKERHTKAILANAFDSGSDTENTNQGDSHGLSGTGGDDDSSDWGAVEAEYESSEEIDHIT